MSRLPRWPKAASLLAIIGFSCGSAFGQQVTTAGRALPPTLPPPEQVAVQDTPNDAGGSLTLEWIIPVDASWARFEIWRSPAGAESFELVTTTDAGISTYVDKGLVTGEPYEYRVRSVIGGKTSEFVTTDVAALTFFWFNMYRLNAVLLFALFCCFVTISIRLARAGYNLFIRRISGLNEVDEAVGRATEMGRKIIYIPGIMSLNEPQTIASLAVLKHVAGLSARNSTALEVPNIDPLTFSSARETVKEAYLEEGRPDLYNEDMVTYITYDQFAYTAAVAGKMLREKPATNFLIGSFYAESLLLAETGQAAGAIQISGTAELAQLPFFVVACDYTMIGEELYAASAYLSKEPVLIGTIKGQDMTKLVLLLAVIAGVVLETFGITGFTRFMSSR